MGAAEVEHLLEAGRPAWQAQARCYELKLNGELFFPGFGYDEKAAKAVCRECLVREECLEAGITGREPGVWGGTNPAERRRIVRVRLGIAKGRK